VHTLELCLIFPPLEKTAWVLQHHHSCTVPFFEPRSPSTAMPRSELFSHLSPPSFPFVVCTTTFSFPSRTVFEPSAVARFLVPSGATVTILFILRCVRSFPFPLRYFPPLCPLNWLSTLGVISVESVARPSYSCLATRSFIFLITRGLICSFTPFGLFHHPMEVSVHSGRAVTIVPFFLKIVVRIITPGASHFYCLPFRFPSYSPSVLHRKSFPIAFLNFENVPRR